ncbi:MAG: hypothetical protein ACYS8W_20380 [Planctomycetota bacterium]
MSLSLSRKPLAALVILMTAPLLFSCSDDRPVGDTLKPDRNIDDLIKEMYDPEKRDKAAKRLGQFTRFIVGKLIAEVTNNTKSSPDEIIARVMMLQMLGRHDGESEIDGLLVRLFREGEYPAEISQTAARIARDRAARRERIRETR